MENVGAKTFFLYLLICSIALSALMGIWAIISGEFGELQGKILGTTTTVVGTSILGLACGAYLESPRSSQNAALKIVPILGIVFTVVSALIVLWLVWLVDRWDGNSVFKILAVSVIFAFSLAQLSLLSLARLAERFRWSLVAAYFAVLTLASIGAAIITFEFKSDDGLVLRLLGVLAVVDAALTVMIPIFHRLSRAEFADGVIPSADKIDAEIAKLKNQISHLEKQKEDILNAEDKN